MISVVTPTRGGERKQFVGHLTGVQLPAQTYQNFEHILVDEEPKVSGMVDLTYRVRKGVKQCKGDIIVIMEDDDYYPDDYLQTIADAFGKSNKGILGWNETIYYHLGHRRLRRINHPHRSSLFSTAFTNEFISRYVWPEGSLLFLDIDLWTHYPSSLTNNIMLSNPKQIGIKHGIGLVGGKFHRSPLASSFPENDKYYKWLESNVRQESYIFYRNLEGVFIGKNYL